MAAQFPGSRPSMSTPSVSAGMKRVAAKKAAVKKPASTTWQEQTAEGTAARPAPGGVATLGYLVGRQYRKGINAKSDEAGSAPNLAINLAKLDKARGNQFKK